MIQGRADKGMKMWDGEGKEANTGRVLISSPLWAAEHSVTGALGDNIERVQNAP